MVDFILSHPLVMTGIFVVLVAIPLVWEIVGYFRVQSAAVAVPVKTEGKSAQGNRKK